MAVPESVIGNEYLAGDTNLRLLGLPVNQSLTFWQVTEINALANWSRTAEPEDAYLEMLSAWGRLGF